MLRSELNVHEAICRKLLSEVRVDHEITGVLPEIHADTWRSTVIGAIRGFESARHQVRFLLVAIEVEEGGSISEVAQSWGVSRQLASRWVHESATVEDVRSDHPLGARRSSSLSSSCCPAPTSGSRGIQPEEPWPS